MITYPTRCIIIDVDGSNDFHGVSIRTPETSRPHIGKEGLAEEIEENGFLTVKITLDDGNILYGYECWWYPLNGK